MKSLLCSALAVVAAALSSSTVEANTIPNPEPLPDPPAWSLVVLPKLDWTPEEAARASALLAQINPDMIFASERWNRLKPLASQVPDCRIELGDPVPSSDGAGFFPDRIVCDGWKWIEICLPDIF